MTLYVLKNGQQLGPFSLAQANRMVATASLKPEDLAWFEGCPDWIPLSEVPGFTIQAVRTQFADTSRPRSVYIICIWYVISVVAAILVLMALPRDHPQLQWSSLAAIFFLLKLIAVVCLFCLRRIAFPLLIATFVLGLVLRFGPVILIQDWAWAIPHVFTIILATAIDILVLSIVKRLHRDHILR